MNDPEHDVSAAQATDPDPGAADGGEAIDSAVLDELERAHEPSSPRPDPWSRPGRPVETPSMPAVVPVAASPPPRGWEWSRTASADVSWTSSFTEAAPVVIAPRPALAADAVLQRPETTAGRIGLDVFALLMALVGGLLALIGSFFQELQSGVWIFLIILAAPVIEEVLKPSGIYLLLLKWPQALRGQLHTALLCAISGAVFGIIESLIYVELYYPDGSDAFVLFRFTVTPIMHTVASFIVGYGLSRSLIDWANGKSGLPTITRNHYLLGIGIHAAYNTSAVILGALGALDFLETALLR